MNNRYRRGFKQVISNTIARSLKRKSRKELVKIVNRAQPAVIDRLNNYLSTIKLNLIVLLLLAFVTISSL